MWLIPMILLGPFFSGGCNRNHKHNWTGIPNDAGLILPACQLADAQLLHPDASRGRLAARLISGGLGRLHVLAVNFVIHQLART